MGYCELLPKSSDAEAVPMCDGNSIVHRQRVQQFHKGCASSGCGYVEVKHDVVHGERQTVLGRYEVIMIMQRGCHLLILKYWKSVLLDIGRPHGKPDTGRTASAGALAARTCVVPVTKGILSVICSGSWAVKLEFLSYRRTDTYNSRHVYTRQ